jgi:hypothetical protein
MWPPANKTITEIAHEQALEIYHIHQPPPLPDGAADRIALILDQAELKLQ